MTTRTPVSVTSQRRRAAHVMHAKHGVETTVRGRDVARQRLEERLALQYGITVGAPDYQDRMDHAISAHFAGLRAKRSAS